MGNVIPLAFNDPDMQRETYVGAFVATIRDKWDGTPLTEQLAIEILWRYGYDKSSIAAYAGEACQQLAKELSKNGRS